MLYALRGKFPIFHDTVGVHEAVFESDQERPAVVGHRVWFSKARTAHRAERSSHPILLPTLPGRCLTVTRTTISSGVQCFLLT